MPLGVAWAFISHHFEPYHVQTFLGLSFCFGLVAWQLGRKFHFLVGLIYAYLAVTSLWLSVYPFIRWDGFDISEIAGFECQITESFLFLTAICLMVLFLTGKTFGTLIVRFLRSVALCNTLVLTWKLLHGESPYFLFNNPAIDTGFIGVTIPLFTQWRAPWDALYIALAGFVCLEAKTSTGVLALGLSVSMYYWALGKFRLWATLLGASVAGAIASAGFLLQRDVLFHSSGRTWAWKVAWDFFWGRTDLSGFAKSMPQYSALAQTHISSWIGSGLGTYQMYGPVIEMFDMIKRGAIQYPGFFWMHNDYLQVLFETGLVGLLLTLAVLTLALFRARHVPAVFAALVSYSAVAFIQMPLRHFLFACLGAWLIVLGIGAHYLPKSDTKPKVGQ